MEKNLYIDASHPNETRVVLKSEKNIEDYEYEGLKNNLIKNNIYLGKVSRIEPSLQAAFIDFGRDRHGFLSFNDIQSDYYQIPKSDLEIIKQQEELAREELSKKVAAKEEKNLAEGKLEIDDPLEVEKEIEDKQEEDLEIASDKTKLTENDNQDEKTNENSENDDNKQISKPLKFKRYKIQEVIKPNQVILVQVIKDERGQKGAALSTFISIAGKYIVLMPNTPKGGGISRKIFNPADRKKIRSILNEIEIPKEMGLIVRTAGSNKTKNEINQDLETLKNTWNQIKDNALNSIAPALIHQESEIIKRTLRDMYDENTKNIIVEGNEGYKKAQNFMKMMMPSHVKKIKKYRGKIPLFIEENIEQKLNQIFDSEIKLNSGGYLVVNPTEALVSIPDIDYSKWGEIKIDKLSKFQKTASKNLHTSWINIPHVTQHDDADITELLELRKKLNEQHGLKVSPLAYIIKATVETLKLFPLMNTSLTADLTNIVQKNYFNIGIAVDTPDGLIVPNIKNTEDKTVLDISNEVFELAKQAKNRKLKVDQLKGATFTISSLSGIGGKYFTPIINPPEVGILGLSKTFNHVSLKDGEVKESKQMPVSLSYDHRVINGAYAAKFITEFSAQLNRIQYLEDTFNNA